MEEEYKEEKATQFNMRLYEDHIKYLRTLKNYSHYMRWMVDNDEGYKKYMFKKYMMEKKK